jgi:hypothetical protein
VPGPYSFEVEIKFKKLKSPGNDQISAELIHYGLRSINSITAFGIRKNYLTNGRSLFLY